MLGGQEETSLPQLYEPIFGNGIWDLILSLCLPQIRRLQDKLPADWDSEPVRKGVRVTLGYGLQCLEEEMSPASPQRTEGAASMQL